MPKITELYAFIAEDKGPEDEGLAAFLSLREWVPMVAADRPRVESLRAIAQDIARDSKKPIHLVKFSVREELELIQP